ncbi:hypothetical protein WN51_12299 [Melipona quadrifasciata]|uniref:Uncharacterized protein n=1 Tax=Melipona quadrifasciata TaxID=166423 RepID=A0A0N0BKZ9_9HYME|nr:hypothetical protein WN51_12299 [Melipona quadrifasciata]
MNRVPANSSRITRRSQAFFTHLSPARDSPYCGRIRAAIPYDLPKTVLTKQAFIIDYVTAPVVYIPACYRDEYVPKRPRIPQIRVSNTRLAQAASGCAPSVDVLPIFDVKQQSVRNPARMGANQPSRFSYNKRLGHNSFGTNFDVLLDF